MSWTHDGVGMFYNRYPKQEGKSDGTETSTNLHQKLYYHVLGTDQSKDVLCAEFPDNPKWMGGATVSDDGRYALLSISEGCDPVNRLWYCDLHKQPHGINGILPWEKLIDNFDAEYDYITNEGTVFTFKTNRNAPKYKLINIDFSDPVESRWKELVLEHEKDVLEWVACVYSKFLVLCYLHDVKNVLQLRDLATGRHLKTLPLDVGSIVGYSGQKKDSEIFYQFTSFLSPGIIYHYDLTKDTEEPKSFPGNYCQRFLIHRTTKQYRSFTPAKMEPRYLCLLSIKRVFLWMVLTQHFSMAMEALTYPSHQATVFPDLFL
ncbi:unnamed protein product [Staurois parvus]|uniref:Peptidase S9A N-terminal domain-containing protein n=1 Tax=Staurois parvus TaxID=386267 RepID=A0ABN9F4C7_9NEOB|nr:unnamed protein product [Staurois parvus]